MRDHKPGVYWVQVWCDGRWQRVEVGTWPHDEAGEPFWMVSGRVDPIHDDDVAVLSDRLIPPTPDDEVRP